MSLRKIIFLLLTISFVAVACSNNDENTYPEIKSGTFTDARNNIEYTYVTIGPQTWMAENLNYSNGSGSWAYNNDDSYANVYGLLYDWETACESCPEGWHLPSREEFNELRYYIGEHGFLGTEGMALKAEKGWSEEGNGTDNFGFKALPGGCNDNYTSFQALREKGYFWTSDKANDGYAYRFKLECNSNAFRSADDNETIGYSVRCLKD